MRKLLMLLIVLFSVFTTSHEIQTYQPWDEIYEVSPLMDEINSKVIQSYDEFNAYVSNYSKSLYLHFDEYDYLLIRLNVNGCGEDINGLIKSEVNNQNITLNIGYNGSCGVCAPESEYYLIPFEKGSINDSMAVIFNYKMENRVSCDPNVSYKPIIYLYPEEDMNISVKLGYKDKLTTTYPKYNDGWEVYAKTNGDLIDLKTNKTYYGLYWEGLNTSASKIRNEGFVVKGEDSSKFLEEKLEILGLNERETNEFIIYWLPKLEANKYNYIYFENLDEINKNMPLEINPKPETTIRVLMEFKGLEKPLNIKEQKLEKIERKGYTLVEWGGTELN